MRIGYVAAFDHSFSTETHVARDARSLGHDVTEITSGDPATIETACADADLVVCQRTGLPVAMVGVWERLAGQGVQTCSYHLDLYLGLKRETQIATDPFWRTHTVFTADGDPHTTEQLARQGVNHKWLPAAVVSDETLQGTWRDEYDYDVVFVGARRYHPEWPQRQQLITYLERRYGTRFRLFDHHPPTRDQDLNDLYATARVVVGDTLAFPGHSRFVSDRLFETTGRGGALVFPRVPGVESELGFRDPDHLRFYDIGDLDGLISVVDDLLAHPEETRLMAKRGQQFTALSHTYRHRVQQMLLELDYA